MLAIIRPKYLYIKKLKYRCVQLCACQCYGIPFTVVQFFVINAYSSCVVYGKFNKYYTYIVKILKLMVLIVKVHSEVYSIKYDNVIK
jgi:hypothetical protein